MDLGLDENYAAIREIYRQKLIRPSQILYRGVDITQILINTLGE